MKMTHRVKDKKISVGIRITAAAYERLQDRAWAEHRTVSALTAIIVEEAMTPRKPRERVEKP